MFKKILILFIIIIIFSVSVLGTYIYYNLYFYKIKGDIEFEVKRGWGLKNVINELHKIGIVHNIIFTYYPYFLANRDYIAKNGVYKFENNSNLVEILSKIKNGDSIKYKLTIPPGLNLKEIASLLEKKGIMTKKQFLNIATDKQFLKNYPIYKETLEGFIFPETYIFNSDLSNEDVVKIFVDYFFKKVSEIIDIKNYSKKDFYNKIIIASLVEKEAMVDFERPIIASVIYNRLKARMYLGLCPTVEYAIGEHKKRLDLDDLKVKSPFNTYIHKGLPPTPICNPSLQSIKAAFFPENTKYLYYVAKFDGTHYFSETFEQHIYYKNLVKRETRK